MKNFFHPFILWLNFIFFFFSFLQAEVIEEKLNEAIQLYRQTRYERAIAAFKTLLPSLKEKKDLITAHKYLGLCYGTIHQTKLAEEEFVKMLRLEATIELKKGYYLPRIMKIFQKAKLKLEQEKITPPPSSLPANEAISPSPKLQVKLKESYPVFFNLLPGGYPQFKNKEAKKGWAILGVELFCLGASIWLDQELEKRWDPELGFPPSYEKQAKNLVNCQRVLLLLGILSYFYSIFDGFKNKEGK